MSPFEPYDIEREDIELDQPEKPDLEPEEKEEKEKIIKKVRKVKPKKPVSDVIEIPLEKGTPKPTEDEEEPTKKFRIPEKDLEDKEEEKIKLKPFVKEKK